MPVFQYSGRDAQTSEARRGKVKAASYEEAIAYLRNQKRIDVAVCSEVKKAKTVEEIFARWQDIPFDSIVSFTRNMATMLEAGIPILSVLETMVEQEENDKLRVVLELVLGDVATGVAFESALASHREVFDDLYIAMVKAGAEGGDIGKAMLQLATQLEQTQKMRRAVKSALIYPKVVVSISSVIISGLMIIIVPKFAAIFKSTAAELSTPQQKLNPALPKPTQYMLDFSHLLYPQPGAAGHNMLWFGQVLIRIAIAVVAVVFFRKFWKVLMRKDEMHRRWDQLKMRLPMKLGQLVQMIAIARFARTLSSLRSAGVPALESMAIVADAAGNFVVTQALLKVMEEMQQGSNIHEPLERTGVFPPMVIKYVATGEETGNLETMLEKLAISYEQEVDLRIAGLTKIIEPLMIIVVGGMIGAIVICTYLPMFDLYNLIGNQ